MKAKIKVYYIRSTVDSYWNLRCFDFIEIASNCSGIIVAFIRFYLPGLDATSGHLATATAVVVTAAVVTATVVAAATEDENENDNPAAVVAAK